MTDESSAAERSILDEADVRYGYQHGYLSEADVVSAATRAWEAGDHSPPIQELMCLLQEDHGRVPEVLASHSGATADRHAQQERSQRKWIYLRLADLVARDLPARQLFDAVDEVYADNDYPPYLAPLASYMPVADPDAAGPQHLRQRILDYVEAEQAAFT